jgi:hypothetical protein
MTTRIVIDPTGLRRAAGRLEQHAVELITISSRRAATPLPEMPEGVAAAVSFALADVGTGLTARAGDLGNAAAELRLRAQLAEIADAGESWFQLFALMSSNGAWLQPRLLASAGTQAPAKGPKKPAEPNCIDLPGHRLQICRPLFFPPSAQAGRSAQVPMSSGGGKDTAAPIFTGLGIVYSRSTKDDLKGTLGDMISALARGGRDLITKLKPPPEAADASSLAAEEVPQGLTEAQFSRASQLLRDGSRDLGGEIGVQGSRAGYTASPESDIDFAVRVSRERFKTLVDRVFGAPNPGSAWERTMQRAVESGKIQAGEAGLSPLRQELQRTLGGIDVHLSVIEAGGMFDNGPWMPIR